MNFSVGGATPVYFVIKLQNAKTSCSFLMFFVCSPIQAFSSLFIFLSSFPFFFVGISSPLIMVLSPGYNRPACSLEFSKADSAAHPHSVLLFFFAANERDAECRDRHHAWLF